MRIMKEAGTVMVSRVSSSISAFRAISCGAARVKSGSYRHRIG